MLKTERLGPGKGVPGVNFIVSIGSKYVVFWGGWVSGVSRKLLIYAQRLKKSSLTINEPVRRSQGLQTRLMIWSGMADYCENVTNRGSG